MNWLISNLRGSMHEVLDQRIFRFLEVSITVTFLGSYVLTYLALAPFLVQEQTPLARHACHLAGLIPVIGTVLALGAIRLARTVIQRSVTRKATALTARARDRYENGSSGSLRTRSWISEIEELGDILDRLFSEQLARIEELIQLGSILRHNMNNIMTCARNDAFSLGRCCPGIRAVANRIMANIDSLSRILAINLTITENYNRVSERNRERVDLCELVSECVEAHSPLAIERDIALNAHVPDREVLFLGHEQKIMNALHNLVDNAIKYSDAGASVDVSLDAADDRLTIRIADTGIGIPHEDIPKLFRRGFRASTRGDRPGEGLGLAFVHSVVTLYRGTIACASEPGVGTTFTITLPCRKEHMA